jgi:hypothetical protein
MLKSVRQSINRLPQPNKPGSFMVSGVKERPKLAVVFGGEIMQTHSALQILALPPVARQKRRRCLRSFRAEHISNFASGAISPFSRI